MQDSGDKMWTQNSAFIAGNSQWKQKYTQSKAEAKQTENRELQSRGVQSIEGGHNKRQEETQTMNTHRMIIE